MSATATRTLTEDQRWLLRMIGGWALREALLSSGGVMRLMQSMQGGTGHRLEAGPEWMRGGFQCGRGKVVSPSFGTPVVTITADQINRYAASLPGDIRAELTACREAERAESRRTWKWCRCGNEIDCLEANDGDPVYGGRHHPTEAEEEAHYVESRRITDWLNEVLDRALSLADDAPQQLDLFEVGA